MNKSDSDICPQCEKPIRNSHQNPASPFCNERCRLIDLGAWLDGNRCIAGDEPAAIPEDFSSPEDPVRH